MLLYYRIEPTCGIRDKHSIYNMNICALYSQQRIEHLFVRPERDKPATRVRIDVFVVCAVYSDSSLVRLTGNGYMNRLSVSIYMFRRYLPNWIDLCIHTRLGWCQRKWCYL